MIKSPFRYVATVREEDVRTDEISVRASCPADSAGPELAGSSPVIRFWQDQMILIAAPIETAQVKWCSFRIGDVVIHATRAGDLIETTRNVFGHVGLSIVRQQRLIVAVGHLWMANLGTTASVVMHHAGAPHGQVEVRVGHETCSLGAAGVRDAWRLRRLRRRRRRRLARTSVSIAAVADPIVVNAARRSAVLMAWHYPSLTDSLRGEHLDGTYMRAEFQIP